MAERRAAAIKGRVLDQQQHPPQSQQQQISHHLKQLLSHSFDNNSGSLGVGGLSSGGSAGYSFSNVSKNNLNHLAGIPMNSNTYDYHNN